MAWPVRVLEPGKSKTRTGHLWVYVQDDRNAGAATPPAVWFSYSADRKGEHPQRHLSGYRGIPTLFQSPVRATAH